MPIVDSSALYGAEVRGGATFEEKKSHQRDCGQEVFDGEVRNDDLILCYDGRNTIFGDSFHDVE
jgi:hypothetical protein